MGVRLFEGWGYYRFHGILQSFANHSLGEYRRSEQEMLQEEHEIGRTGAEEHVERWLASGRQTVQGFHDHQVRHAESSGDGAQSTAHESVFGHLLVGAIMP